MKFIQRYNTLTEKQVKTGRYIEKFIKKNGYRPTLKKIGEHFGLSAKSSVWNRYNGYLKNIENCPFCGNKKSKTKVER